MAVEEPELQTLIDTFAWAGAAGGLGYDETEATPTE